MLSGRFHEDNVQFQSKIIELSGLGQNTCLPPAVLRVPPNPNLTEGSIEMEIVIFGAIDELLAKTRVKTNDIGILVLNSGLFNRTPSLTALVVNQYKLRGNVITYNLAGMGCGAGIVLIDLVRHLLQGRIQELVDLGINIF
ncbi:hypothetical protein Sjap_008120 [Stephania japonica]|uniref:FAE domain-containing protein n=1 Tax=Stephania japonica TaxID=461633 RepID=A0AAP0JNW6_9MAGN